MTTGINLPRPHAFRAQWAPLNFFPLPGSADRLTIAVVAVGPDASFYVAEAEGLSRLHCLFGEEGLKFINFVSIGIEGLRSALRADFTRVMQGGASFSGSIELGEFQFGSGDSLEDIATSWLKQISLLSNPEDRELGIFALGAAVDVGGLRSPRILPAIREEIATMAPFLANNFGQQFRPAGKALPVKLGYKGKRIVADFTRLSPTTIGASLEKVRGKLWTLSEHRDQTRHERFREHEMFVIRKPSYEDDQSTREISIIERACADLMEEADRREIRFRPFSNPREVAQRIYQVEVLQPEQTY